MFAGLAAPGERRQLDPPPRGCPADGTRRPPKGGRRGRVFGRGDLARREASTVRFSWPRASRPRFGMSWCVVSGFLPTTRLAILIVPACPDEQRGPRVHICTMSSGALASNRFYACGHCHVQAGCAASARIPQKATQATRLRWLWLSQAGLMPRQALRSSLGWYGRAVPGYGGFSAAESVWWSCYAAATTAPSAGAECEALAGHQPRSWGLRGRPPGGSSTGTTSPRGGPSRA